jgi:NAD-dependent SIR2 family protein deacetylase
LEALAGLASNIEDPSSHVVELHGNLTSLRCLKCQAITPWLPPVTLEIEAGRASKCPNCLAARDERRAQGKRDINIGLRIPNIILYDQLHPHDERIKVFKEEDLRQPPSSLLIVGTSLRIPGAQHLIQEFSQRGVTVFYLNNETPPSKMTAYIDIHLYMECDAFASHIMSYLPDPNSRAEPPPDHPAPPLSRLFGLSTRPSSINPL